jgi:hypothetical protein
MSTIFIIELLQAVNDWQRDSSSEAQRAKREQAIQTVLVLCPQSFANAD